MQGTLPIFAYKVVNKTGDENTLELMIAGDIVDEPTRAFYDEYYGDKTSASFTSVKKQIDDSKCTALNVIINSPGGSVTEAFAIHDYLTLLKSKGVTVNTYGMGLIASAATVILMAGGKNSHIYENAWFMIHNPSSGFYGDSKQAMEFANTLQKFKNKISNFYVSCTRMSADEIGDMMDNETWMDGSECHSLGFVKNLLGAVEAENTYTENTLKNLGYKNFKSSKMSTPNNSIENKFDTFANKLTSLFNDLKNSLNPNKPEATTTTTTTGLTHEQLSNALGAMNTGIVNAVKEMFEANKPDVATEITNFLATDAGKEVLNAYLADKYATKEELESLATDVANRGPAKKSVDNSKQSSVKMYAGIDVALLDQIETNLDA